MVNILAENGKKAYGIIEYICDTDSDVEDLATVAAAGSTAFVIENSKTYMLNGEKEWVEVTL